LYPEIKLNIQGHLSVCFGVRKIIIHAQPPLYVSQNHKSLSAAVIYISIIIDQKNLPRSWKRGKKLNGPEAAARLL
jgi:hypothetical protein